MKNGWQTKALKEVCQFLNGLWKGEKPPFVNVGVIRNTNFTKDGTLDESEIAFIDVEAKKLEKRKLQFGDIILEKSGGGPRQPVGRVALFDKKNGTFSFSNFTATLRVIDTDELDFRYLHKFLYWIYLSGVTEQMQSHSTGIRNLDGDAYKAIKIQFPSLPEQRRIVGILDEAFAGIATAKANAERNLQNAHALFESHLESVFAKRGEGWVEKRLDEACEIIMGQSPDGESYNSTGEGVPLINGPVEFSPDPFGSTVRAKFTTHPTKLCKKDDLILCVRGSTTGRMNIAGFDACVGRGVAAIRGKEYQPWINHFINAKREDIYSLGTGATFPNVSGAILGGLKLSFPDLVTQREIVSKFDSLRAETERLARLYDRKLAALEELKKSLLHQAFSGEL